MHRPQTSESTASSGGLFLKHYLRELTLCGYSRVFISGPATYVDAGVFKVEPGADPNFPTENQVQYRNGRARIKVYVMEIFASGAQVVTK